MRACLLAFPCSSFPAYLLPCVVLLLLLLLLLLLIPPAQALAPLPHLPTFLATALAAGLAEPQRTIAQQLPHFKQVCGGRGPLAPREQGGAWASAGQVPCLKQAGFVLFHTWLLCARLELSSPLTLLLLLYQS